MLLLLPELLSIALRTGSAQGELDAVDIISGLVVAKLYNVTRACDAA